MATARSTVRRATTQPNVIALGGLRLSAAGTTADRVAAVLVDYIRRNRLSAGADLPSEIQTSNQLRVSRGVVREAYRSLSSAGVVEIANGRSPRVGLISNRSLLRVMQHALWTDQASAEQIFELRGPIEERAAELAARNRSASDVDALRRAVAAMRAAGPNADAYVAADIQFHELMGRASGNPLFALVASALREAMGASIRGSFVRRRSAAEIRRTVDTHDRIVDAVEARRPRKARQLMARHFEEARKPLRRQLAPAVAITGLALRRTAARRRA